VALDLHYDAGMGNRSRREKAAKARARARRPPPRDPAVAPTRPSDEEWSQVPRKVREEIARDHRNRLVAAGILSPAPSEDRPERPNIRPYCAICGKLLTRSLATDGMCYWCAKHEQEAAQAPRRIRVHLVRKES
jgi:hypothetical protein